MNGIPAKKIKSRPQNWISLINFVENRSKQKVRLPYCNLYAYAANNPLHYIDPDGRSPGDLFDSPDEAAIDFAHLYNDDSIRKDVELASLIHKTSDGKFYYETPYTNEEKSVVQQIIDPLDSTIYAMIHTHSKYDPEILCEFFSFGEESSDLGTAQLSNLISYLVTPGGKLLKYIPTGDFKWDSFGKVEHITDPDIPSDPNSANRRATDVDANKGNDNYYVVRKRI